MENFFEYDFANRIAKWGFVYLIQNGLVRRPNLPPKNTKKKEPSGSFLFIILDPFRENVLLEDSSDRKNRTIACI